GGVGSGRRRRLRLSVLRSVR
ncbi:unnamed protein product, partial [Rotaria sp. Silwood2]